MKKQTLIRTTEAKRCGICGHKYKAGTLMKPMSTRERDNEFICPACLMRHKSLQEEENLYTTPITDKNEADAMIYRKKKNRGIV